MTNVLIGVSVRLGALALFLLIPEGRGPEDLAGLQARVEELERELAATRERAAEARRLADLDSLTGLHNRRFFHETLAREVSRAQRYGRTLALIVLDVDDFKAVNDRMGHLAGDSVLSDVAARVLGVMRASDVACRVGGDEFAVILPESTVDDADQLCRRIQETVGASPFGQAGTLSLAAGVAELASGDDATSLFQRADDVLYRTKMSRERPRESSRFRADP